MNQKRLLEHMLPALGGRENVRHCERKSGILSIRVIDRSVVDLGALRQTDGVEAAELNRNLVTLSIPQLFLEEKKTMAKNYEEMSTQILEHIGGKENVTFANHCMTRLRLTVADKEKIDQDAVKNIPGVLGAQFSGSEFQIIIGQDVPKLYDAICALGGFKKREAIQENLDDKKFDIKQVPKKIMGALTGCLTPLIPVLLVSGMFKMVAAVFGPDMLGWIPAGSNLLTLVTFVGDAGFYFFPVMIGYTGAKKFDCSPILGIMMGGVLLHPTLIDIVNAGDPFSVFGIPMTLTSYASTVIPMILIMWIMGYVEKFFKKYIPDVLSTVFVPLLTVVVMLPLALCVLGPLGTILSTYVINFLMAIYRIAGPIGVGVIAALYLPLVATGMHLPLVSIIMLSLTTVGYDEVILPGAWICIYTDIVLDLAIALKAKNAEDRSLGISCMVAQALGGVGEPTIFGILFRYKKALAWALIGNFCGGFVAGLLHATVSFISASNILLILTYGKDMGKAAIAILVGCAVTFTLTMLFGYEDGPSDKKFSLKRSK